MPQQQWARLQSDVNVKLRRGAWYRVLKLMTEDGSPVPREARPLVVALEKRQAAHRAFRFQGFDGVVRKIEATAFPLEGQGGRHLGAVVILWEQHP